jgi:hypothetical protein
MSSAISQTIAAIIDNYADAIQGGNTNRGSGTVYLGIPGHYSHDEGLESGADTPLTVVENTALSPTTFDVAPSYSWPTLRWVKDETPRFWAHCTTVSSPNYDQARQISNYNNSHLATDGKTRAPLFTVASPFTHVPVAGEVYEILHGFQHIAHGVEVEKDYPTVQGGYDRFFSISVDQGKILEYYGAGVQTYTGMLRVKLRILKYGKSHDAEKSVLENLAIIRSILTRGELRDGAYVRALLPTDGKVETLKEDGEKIVAVDSYPIVYRVGTTYA